MVDCVVVDALEVLGVGDTDPAAAVAGFPCVQDISEAAGLDDLALDERGWRNVVGEGAQAWDVVTLLQFGVPDMAVDRCWCPEVAVAALLGRLRKTGVIGEVPAH